MRLYEHEAKRVFALEGLCVPKSYGVLTTGDPRKLKAVRFPAMVKAQVLVGGRGKAGGVKKVASLDEATAACRDILSLTIKDYRVESVLLEAACEVEGACYLAVAVNPWTSNVVVMASAAGGVEIEEVAAKRPEAILRLELAGSPDTLPQKEAAKIGQFLAEGLGLDKARSREFSDAAARLYGLYQKYDCQLAEINPLLVTHCGVVAADGKMVIDDNAIYRQHELLDRLGIAGKRHEVSEPTEREKRASAAGFTYVDLLPVDRQKDPSRIHVGLVPGGAGYGIFSIDEVSNIGDRFFDGRVVPVNFMDSGGGPTVAAVAQMFALLMDYPIVDVIVTSRFGGISSCDVFIRGVIQCLRDRHASGERIVPVYGRMVGTDLAAGRATLERARQETPEALEPLSMVVGNQKIMAEVIREALADFVAKKGAAR